MSRQITLNNKQAAQISSMAFQFAKNDLEKEFRIPKTAKDSYKEDRLRFIKVSEIYLGDQFGAIDVVFELDGAKYIYTIEQTIAGDYCSGFDPEYKHVARRLKRRRRR